MNSGKIIFSQVIDQLPLYHLRQCISRYRGNYKVKQFGRYDQYLSMVFAQLTYRESLRDIKACLRAQKSKLYHMGIRCGISRNTLANANKVRDWRIYADFAQVLICIARDLYHKEDFGIELEETVYALDSTTIDLSLSTFPRAHFRSTKAAVKLHTLLDLRGNIPTFLSISDGKLHDVNILDELIPEPGSFYVMDRGYLDFSRLYTLNCWGSFFVIRAKSNFKFARIYSHPVDKETSLRCDQTVRLNGYYSAKDYPATLRRVKCFDAENDKLLVFLTNNFTLPAQVIADLYRCRWQVELYFKWIKQHLRIKSFFGTSENALKTQIWIAVSVYVAVAIIKKQYRIEASLYTMLQIVSVTVFEKIPLLQVFDLSDYKSAPETLSKQLKLFD